MELVQSAIGEVRYDRPGLRFLKPALQGRSGFSLIELALVLLVVSMLMTAGLRIVSAQMDSTAYSVTKTRETAIRDALINYLGNKGRLPCPDSGPVYDGTEKRTISPGLPANCTKYFGIVPYAELGIDKDLATDGWENFIAYGVSSNWTLTYNAAAVTGTPQTSVAGNAFSVGAVGNLTVNDRVPVTNTTPTLITSKAAAVLVSYGKNGLGAVTASGRRNVLPALTTSDEYDNVNLTGALTTYFKRDYSDTDVANYGAFDDVVSYFQSGDLVAPLTRDGSLNSVSASLSQTFSAINDAILGGTIASHAPGGPYALPGSIGTNIDPWGNPIAYLPRVASITSSTTATNDIAYTLTSNGPDKVSGTSDDTVVTMQLTRLQGIFARLGY